MSKKENNPFLRFVKDAWDAIADQNAGRIPSLETVVDYLLEHTPAVAMDGLKRAAAKEAVNSHDSTRTATAPEHGRQLALTGTGWPDLPDTFWKLGDSERVRVRSALKRDHQAHVGLVEVNARRVEDARRAVHDGYVRLEPYYSAGAETVAEAVSRWEADQAKAVNP